MSPFQTLGYEKYCKNREKVKPYSSRSQKSGRGNQISGGGKSSGKEVCMTSSK